LSKTVPQLAPRASHVDGHEGPDSGVVTTKLESSPMLGNPLELDPLVVASMPEEPDDELPLVATELPEPDPKPFPLPAPLAAHPKNVARARHAAGSRNEKRSMCSST
jgi:hypothetical protein